MEEGEAAGDTYGRVCWDAKRGVWKFLETTGENFNC